MEMLFVAMLMMPIIWCFCGMTAWILKVFIWYGPRAIKPYILNVLHPWRLLRESTGGVISLMEVLMCIPLVIELKAGGEWEDIVENAQL